MPRPLFNRGFIALIITQFFGAANDNVLKGVLTFAVISGVWAGDLGEGGQGIVALCFTLPFLILSGYAGQFADRNSKRTVSVLVKILELPIAGIALVGFVTQNLWITLGALVALTCQSSFFGPAKYGMIPELVQDEQLSRANGIINMMTNIAVIVGMYAAGIVADAYSPKPQLVEHLSESGADPVIQGLAEEAHIWLPGTLMVIIAAFGLISVLFLPKLPVGDKTLTYDKNPFGTYIRSLRQMATSPLLMVAFAWGYFYLLAGFGLLIIPEYATILNIKDQHAAALLALLGITIGAGSIVAGLISGRRIEPRLIPVGVIGLTVFFSLLAIIPPKLAAGDNGYIQVLKSNVAVLIAGAGFFAGFYIIPLQAMLQKLPPESERGRFLGTANAISFSFLALSSLIYWIIRPWFGNKPDNIFMVCAVLMFVGAGFFFWRLRKSGLKRGELQ